MKIILILSLLFFAGNESAFCRQAGWVAIPKTPESNLGKVSKKSKLKDKNLAPVKALPKTGETVYDKQPPVTEAEMLRFISVLPQFRSWANQFGEEAHPIISITGKPDFTYSANASRWIQEHDFNSQRFFCIMGRMAAGIVIVEEGNNYKGVWPADMPEVSREELELIQKHMGELLRAGRTVPPGKVN